MKTHLLLCLFALLLIEQLSGQAITNNFEEVTGDNIYYELNSENWNDGETFGLFPNAGSEMLMSANGNENITFEAIGIEKTLGGVIGLTNYRVSFYVSSYLNMNPITIEDFTTLIIGGHNGTISWDSTPSPELNCEWVKWSGNYVASILDVGEPFIFKAIFNLDSLHSIAIDGPIDILTKPNISVDINEKTQDSLLQIYPNPVTETAMIAISNLIYNPKVILFNAYGAQAKVINPTTNTFLLDTKNLPSGIYFLTIFSAQKLIVTKQIWIN